MLHCILSKTQRWCWNLPMLLRPNASIDKHIPPYKDSLCRFVLQFQVAKVTTEWSSLGYLGVISGRNELAAQRIESSYALATPLQRRYQSFTMLPLIPMPAFLSIAHATNDTIPLLLTISCIISHTYYHSALRPSMNCDEPLPTSYGTVTDIPKR